MQPKFHLERIDILRGIAILLVLGYHTQLVYFMAYDGKNWLPNQMLSVPDLRTALLKFNPFGQGWMGVELFLIISGFLIHLIYKRSNKPFNPRLFYSKRFWRIFPPYYLILTILWLVRPDFSAAGWWHYISHLLMIHNLSDATFFSINASFWSIALEVQLYLLYPVVIWLANRYGLQRVFWLTIGIHLLHLVFKLNTPALTDTIWFDANPLCRWFVWVTGAVLAEQFLAQKRLFKKPLLVVALGYAGLVACRMNYYTNELTTLMATLMCAGLFEWILYGLGEFKNLLMKKLVQFISFMGLISYSFYLIHQAHLKPLLDFLNPNLMLPFWDKFQAITFAWALLLLLAYALYQLIELPSIKIGEKLRSK